MSKLASLSWLCWPTLAVLEVIGVFLGTVTTFTETALAASSFYVPTLPLSGVFAASGAREYRRGSRSDPALLESRLLGLDVFCVVFMREGCHCPSSWMSRVVPARVRGAGLWQA
jgi:hypothetical protein